MGKYLERKLKNVIQNGENTSRPGRIGKLNKRASIVTHNGEGRI